MRQFDIKREAAQAETPEIAALLAQIKAHANSNSLALASGFSAGEKDKVENADDRALAQSAASILGHGGPAVPFDRMLAFVNGADPSTDEERRAYDYLCELATVRAQHRSTHVSPGVILLLHRACFRTAAPQTAGYWRTSGPFAGEIPEIMRTLCDEYRIVTRSGETDPLLASLIFLIDFSALAPLEFGTRDIAWLLFELMLLKNGYDIPRFFSVEQAVEGHRAAFDGVLAAGLNGWAEGAADYGMIVAYLLKAIAALIEPPEGAPARTANVAAAPNGRTARVKAAPAEPETDEDVVRAYFARLTDGVSKQQIIDAHPRIAKHEIDKIIAKLRREGAVEMVGAGRKTRYRKTLHLAG